MKQVIDKGEDNDDRLPRIPVVTEDDLAVINAQQAAMARTHPINASSREYSNAYAVVKDLESHDLKTMGSRQRDLYAESLAIMGSYDKAAKITRDKLKKAEWKEVWKAIWKDDSDVCNCKDVETVEMVKGKVTPVTHSRHFVVNKVFSHRDNKIVNLVRCNKCSKTNTVNE